MHWIPIQFALRKSGFFYSEDHIYRLHGLALKAARALWKKRKEEEHG